MIKLGLTDYTPEDKLIQIRDKDKNIKALYSIGKDDVNKHLLMDEHYIQISFELNKYAAFKRSDYIEFKGEKYTLREDYTPIQENKRKYKYTLLFEAKEMFFQDIEFYYLNQNLKEATWSITTNPATIFQLAVDNINRYFGTNRYNVGTIEPTETKLLQFDKTKVFDGLTQTAKEHNAEWYLTGYTLHLVKKVSFGSEIPFETDVSITKMSREKGEGEKPFTRILALGSTKNLPANYRETSPGEAVDAIYQKRLRIPAEYGDVIDAYPEMLPEEVTEGTKIFDDIFPKRIGEISDVHTVEYTDTNKDTGEVTQWKAYRYKDESLKFKEEYLLPDVELRIIFQSGYLNGLDFAVKFNPDNIPEDDPNAQVFEIYRNDKHGSLLPNELMYPENGNKYILYGFNIDLVGNQYVPEAEIELYEKAIEYQKGLLKDKSVFECPTIIKHFHDNEMDLEIGQRVRLVHEQFEGGKRSSRVQGFEKNLLNPYEAIYTIGDNAVYSRLSEIENNIKELQVSGITTTGGSGSIYLIKQFDDTPPTDFNAYSAKATNARLLSRLHDDRAQGSITFDKNIGSTLFAEGYEWGNGWNVNNEGVGWFNELKVRDNVYIGKMSGSPSSASGMMGYGTILDMQKASGEFDYLLARKEFRVNTMVVNETLGLNGNRFISDFNKIESVQELSDRYRCKIDKIEGMMYMNIRGDDLIRCQQFSGLSSHYYYGEVLGVTEDYFDLRKPLLDGYSVPMAGDTVFRAGHDTDPNRQGVIYLATSDTNAPYIDVLDGLNSPDMTDKTKVRIGNVSGITSKYRGNLGQLGYHHGIYIKGGIFEECDIYLEDGTTIYQSFQIINGKLESEISSIRDAINDNGNNILSNPTWTAGLDKWDYTQDINLFSATNGWLWFNAAFFSDKKSSVELIRDSASHVLRMYKSGITQVNGNLQSRESGTYVMRIRYKAITAGTLTYGFSGKELYKSTLVTATTDYQEETITAEWDGTGDFSCTYSGDIYIKSLTVISDRIAAIRNEFETKFEQTDQSIDLLAKRVTTNENSIITAESKFSVTADWISGLVSRVTTVEGRTEILEEAGFITTPEGNTLWANKTQFDSLARVVDQQSAKFSVNASWISGLVSRVSINENGIRSLNEAGFITESSGNRLWVASTDYTGTSIVNMINQTAEGTKILANKVDFQAYNLNMIRNSGQMTKTTYWSTEGDFSYLSIQDNGIMVINAGTGALINNSLAGTRLFSGRKYTLRISLYTHISQDITISIGTEISTRLSFVEGNSTKTFTFQGKDIDAKYLRLYSQTTSVIVVSQIKLEEGEYATDWTPHPSDSIYSTDSDLVAALNGTTISGGLQLTTRIKLGLLSDGVWTEQGGISANTDNIMLWAGGTYSQAKAGNVKTILRHDGSLKAEGEFECGSKTGNRCLLSGDGRFRMFRGQVEILNLGYFVESDTYYYPSLKMTRKTSSGTAFGEVSVSPTEILFSSPDGLGCIYGNNYMTFNINRFPTSGSMVGAVYRDGNTLKIRTS
jgi:hypothetical protein